MNAIDLLKQQHKKVKDTLETMSKGNVDQDELRVLADELVAHMVIEEHVFYPRIRFLMKDMIGESFEEHTVARFTLARALMASGAEEQKARITVLKELIEHHVKEEEEEMFPKVKKAIAGGHLDELGERMQTMFDKACEKGFEALVRGPSHELHPSEHGMGSNGHAPRKSKSERPARPHAR